MGLCEDGLTHTKSIMGEENKILPSCKRFRRKSRRFMDRFTNLFQRNLKNSANIPS